MSTPPAKYIYFQQRAFTYQEEDDRALENASGVSCKSINHKPPLSFILSVLHTTIFGFSLVMSCLDVSLTVSLNYLMCFSLAHVLSTKMEGVGFMTTTAASHQGAIKLFWPHFSGVVHSSLYMTVVASGRCGGIALL